MAMTQLIHEEKSWSGHERNCAYLNLSDAGSPDFIDVSAACGLDFADDGRSVAITDWDGDGDLDLWLKNRTGPQLRFMKNQGTPGSHFVAFKLTGKTCNRDAIGATVEVRAGGRSLVRTLFAGEGYLAQSSKWLHFGVGPTDRIDEVIVSWPGGAIEKFPGPPVDRRYKIMQGEPSMYEVPRREVTLQSASPAPALSTRPARLVLRSPLPLPPPLLASLLASDSANLTRLIVFWAHWCAPCLTELAELTAHAKRLRDAGIDLLVLNVDATADRDKARALFEKRFSPAVTGQPIAERAAGQELLESLGAILQSVRGRSDDDWPLPSALLIDARGALQIVYLGSVTPKQLVADVQHYVLDPPRANRRSSFDGRWYFRSSRDLAGLARELSRRGCDVEARFYTTMQKHRK